jgi:protein phosphatase
VTTLQVTETVWRTDTGRQRRENEDSAFVRAPVFVVADGMGGAQAGEVAARIATETFEQGLPGSGPPEARLAELVRDANHRIHDRSRAEHGREGMGTTLTAAYLVNGQLAIAHVGDSRAYLLREGQLTRLTQDHSLVDELVRQGKLTEAQAAEHPQRSIITRALGPEPEVEVDTFSYPMQVGDVLLLCSDGLTSMLAEDRVADILVSSPSLEEAADRLIDEANEAGGRDNITVVLCRLGEGEGEGEREAPSDHPTVVTAPAAPEQDEQLVAAGARTSAKDSGVAVASQAATTTKLSPRPERSPRTARRSRRLTKPLAALVALVVVLVLIGLGGYLASRQLYFIGTNNQGIVTIYRGFPYQLPGGLNLYETYVVSGVPASFVPADRRSHFFNNQLRSQTDALSVVRQLELGRISR